MTNRSPDGPGPRKTPLAGSATAGPARPAGTLTLTCTLNVGAVCGQAATHALIVQPADRDPRVFGRCEQHPAAAIVPLIDRIEPNSSWLIVNLPYAAGAYGGQ